MMTRDNKRFYLGLLVSFLGGVTLLLLDMVFGAWVRIFAVTLLLFLLTHIFFGNRISLWWNGRLASLYKREEKRKRKLASKLQKVSEALEKEVNELRRLSEAKRQLNLRNTVIDFIEAIEHRESKKEVRRLFLLIRGSPLRSWMGTWLKVRYRRSRDSQNMPTGKKTEVDYRDGKPGWDVADAFEVAKQLQLQEYGQRWDRHFAKARKLQAKVDELSQGLGIEAENLLEKIDLIHSTEELPSKNVRIRVEESKREKLARLREEIAECEQEASKLEIEILEEEQEHAPGPMRRAAGIPTDDS